MDLSQGFTSMNLILESHVLSVVSRLSLFLPMGQSSASSLHSLTLKSQKDIRKSKNGVRDSPYLEIRQRDRVGKHYLFFFNKIFFFNFLSA